MSVEAELTAPRNGKSHGSSLERSICQNDRQSTTGEGPITIHRTSRELLASVRSPRRLSHQPRLMDPTKRTRPSPTRSVIPR
jgi:hypothetical protein